MDNLDNLPDMYNCIAADLLADNVHYDRFRSPFSDGFSQCSLMFPTDSTLGIGPVHARAVQNTRFVTDTTLQLSLLEESGCRGVHRQRLLSLPWEARESTLCMTASGPLSIEADHLFLHERSVVSEFRFCNTGDQPMTIQPVWTGMVPPDRHAGKGLWSFEAVTPVVRTTFVEPVDDALIAGLRLDASLTDIPQVAIRLRSLTGGMRAWTGTVPLWAGEWERPAVALSACGQALCYAWLAQEPWLLAPGETRTAQFLLDYAVAWHARPTFTWPAHHGRPVDIDVLADERRTLFATRLGTPSVGEAQDQTQLRARATLLRCGVRGLDGAYGDHLACLCTPGVTSFSVVFFWDALFSSAAIADFHPQYAAETIATVLDDPSPTGAFPMRRWNYPVPGHSPVLQPQAPIGGWAADRLYRLRGDNAVLTKLYPRIAANHRFWWEKCDHDGDGLAEWAFNGLTADNSPLYDPYGNGHLDEGNFYIPPIASVSLNCFLYRDAVHLARFADILGLTEDAVLWHERARTLFERFMEVCYVEKERRFWDYNHQTGMHRRVKTFYLFWPLFADMPVPGDLATELIETVLLDPQQFFGPVPFPSVAYNEPTYNPRGYWRGRAWPHISYWLVELLHRYGYEREADAAADRILSWESLHTGHRETLCTDPTESEYGSGGDFSWETGRDYDYNWGAASVYMLAGRHYREAGLNPPPPNGTKK